MPVKAGAFHNVIHLVTCNHDPLCHGYRWNVQNEELLAQLVAWTMQGHYQHAENVLTTLNVPSIPQRPAVQEQAIRHLQLPIGTPMDATIRYHRDGQVFQHIAWLAAIMDAGSRIATLMPHLRPADKGFDSLLIPLTEHHTANAGLYICEEKATDHPRNEIRDNIWPAILKIEKGERDAELNGHVMAILREHQVKNIEEIVADIHWLGKKAYRISITISSQQDQDKARHRLFDGYDQAALGAVTRRRAETVVLPNLRNWMDDFCARVIAKIQGS